MAGKTLDGKTITVEVHRPPQKKTVTKSSPAKVTAPVSSEGKIKETVRPKAAKAAAISKISSKKKMTTVAEVMKTPLSSSTSIASSSEDEDDSGHIKIKIPFLLKDFHVL